MKVVFSFSHSLPIFGGFYFVRIGQLKRKLVIAILLRVTGGNVVFLLMLWFITILKHNAVATLYTDFRGNPMIAAHNERQTFHESVSSTHSIPVTQLKNGTRSAKIMILLKNLFFHLTRNFKTKPSVTSTVLWKYLQVGNCQ